MNSFDKVFFCKRCKKNEWCKVSEVGDRLLINTYVCGATMHMPKEQGV